MVEMDANDNGSSPLPSSSPSSSSSPSFMCALENNRGVINYQRSRPHYNSESIAIRFHNPNNHRQHLASCRCDGEDNCLEVIALGGEPIPIGTVSNWARRRHHPKDRLPTTPSSTPVTVTEAPAAVPVETGAEG